MRNKTWRNVAVMMTVVAGVSMAPVAEAKCGSCGAKTAEATTKKAAEAPDISLADLKQAIADKDVVLIDCNSTKSYASGHIPGAIDLQSAGDGLAGMLPKDKATLIVAYCGGPKCMAYKAGVEAAT